MPCTITPVLSAYTTAYTAPSAANVKITFTNTDASNATTVDLHVASAAVGSAVTGNMICNALPVASAATVPLGDSVGGMNLSTGDLVIAKAATGGGSLVNIMVSSLGL